MGQRTTETDADGRWTFSNVMEGSYTVTALVEDAQAGPVQVVISQGVGTLTGRVLSEKNQGLADIVVLLVPVASERQRFRTAYLTARTGPDGGYSVSGAPGEYFVFARRLKSCRPLLLKNLLRIRPQTPGVLLLLQGNKSCWICARNERREPLTPAGWPKCSIRQGTVHQGSARYHKLMGRNISIAPSLSSH